MCVSKLMWRSGGCRRERKRLFGGISHTNLRELQDMMAQWEDPQLAPQPSCNGDPWCLAEVWPQPPDPFVGPPKPFPSPAHHRGV